MIVADVTVRDPSGRTTTIPLGLRDISVGRSEECEIRIDDPGVSRRHATLGLRLVVQDQKSVNGVWQGSERVETAGLAPGEEVVIGAGDGYQISYTLRASAENSEAAPVGASPSTDEVDSLRQSNATLLDRLRELEEENARLIQAADNLSEPVAPSAPPRPPSEASDSDEQVQADLERTFSAGVPDPHAVLAVTALYSFARRIEGLVSRIALQFQGHHDRDSTILPYHQSNRGLESDTLRTLFSRILNSPSPTNGQALEEYLEKLKRWSVVSTSAYKIGGNTIFKELLQQIDPGKRRMDKGLGLKKDLKPKDAQLLWREFETTMANWTAEIFLDRFEEAAAMCAQNLIEGNP